MIDPRPYITAIAGTRRHALTDKARQLVADYPGFALAILLILLCLSNR